MSAKPMKILLFERNEQMHSLQSRIIPRRCTKPGSTVSTGKNGVFFGNASRTAGLLDGLLALATPFAICSRKAEPRLLHRVLEHLFHLTKRASLLLSLDKVSNIVLSSVTSSAEASPTIACATANASRAEGLGSLQGLSQVSSHKFSSLLQCQQNVLQKEEGF